MIEQRAAPRIATSYAAWLMAHETILIPCTVTNVSPSGAQLCITGDLVMPRQFELRYAANASARRSCRPVWREGDRMGVQFSAEGAL